jgi:hypothetical protein
MIWAGNLGLESVYADRDKIKNLPVNDATGEPLEWPTDPEMEIEFNASTGISYRFAPNWYAGLEALYDREHETNVGTERWSWQVGPTLHYGAKTWWSTLTYLRQIAGGGQKIEAASFNGRTFPGQDDDGLHLVEKTKNELRLKVGYDF